LAYAKQRKQIGRRIAGFQLVQDKLSHMMADITGMQLICLRMAQLQAEGRVGLEHASLAKQQPARGECAPWRATSSAETASCSTPRRSSPRRRGSRVHVRRHRHRPITDRGQSSHRNVRLHLTRWQMDSSVRLSPGRPAACPCTTRASLSLPVESCYW
jgi:hypothetical protein